MTPDEQLPLLLRAISALQRTVPARHFFIAGSQTYAVADFRRAADNAGGEVGAVLHCLIDALEARDDAALLKHAEQQRALIAELRGSAKFARNRIRHVLDLARARKSRSFQQKALHEALEELKESS